MDQKHKKIYFNLRKDHIHQNNEEEKLATQISYNFLSFLNLFYIEFNHNKLRLQKEQP